MSKRNVKDPEERKRELIDTASKLFEQYGYERVSVRDILAEVNGAPGMFYYYFKSKEDIFLACMETYFDEKLKNKLDIFQNLEIDYEERIKMLRDLVVKDIDQFSRKYNFSSNNSITDNSYRLWELAHYIGKFIDVYSEFIIEGVEGGKIENNMEIDRENVKSFAAFILYGAAGTIYTNLINKGENKTNSSGAFEVISKFFPRIR
ncbi:TetR/AcrR family transcriptional regulator [Anaerococcus porci]|uniref:TetR/AcrR family transcriptional regulator n=1 Tax=Anaerococcus porci TaxID=2652269 RepID=UPI002A76577C|nr:TetR/AcrR family transcriptional regulator [Anaerococcus porci]MDY3007243.1 TetR/AcrR family transcriptional regulator [Anaerococcus porci]